MEKVFYIEKKPQNTKNSIFYKKQRSFLTIQRILKN